MARNVEIKARIASVDAVEPLAAALSGTTPVTICLLYTSDAADE